MAGRGQEAGGCGTLLSQQLLPSCQGHTSHEHLCSVLIVVVMTECMQLAVSLMKSHGLDRDTAVPLPGIPGFFHTKYGIILPDVIN